MCKCISEMALKMVIMNFFATKAKNLETYLSLFADDMNLLSYWPSGSLDSIGGKFKLYLLVDRFTRNPQELCWVSYPTSMSGSSS